MYKRINIDGRKWSFGSEISQYLINNLHIQRDSFNDKGFISMIDLPTSSVKTKQSGQNVEQQIVQYQF